MQKKIHIKKGDTVIGNRVRAKVVKNKVAPPFRQAEFEIMYDEGISKVGNILDTALSQGILSRSGAWFIYGGNRLAQGRENTKIYLSRFRKQGLCVAELTENCMSYPKR